MCTLAHQGQGKQGCSPKHLLWGCTSNPSCAVSCKSLEAGIALQCPCPALCHGKLAGQGCRAHVEVEKEGQGRRWGEKEKRESKPKDLFSLHLSVCCSLWWKQDETLPGEQGGRNVGEKPVSRGDCRKHSPGADRRALDREKWQESEGAAQKAESI